VTSVQELLKIPIVEPAGPIHYPPPRLPDGVEGSATLGGDFSRYRYDLRRWWGPGPRVAFIGLNPSTADHLEDDPTIRRCCGFARTWGFDGVIMVNLFAYRSTEPGVLRCQPDPVGPENDQHLLRACGEAGKIVACWGTWGGPSGRRDWADPLCKDPVIAMLGGFALECFGRTKDGSPKHPLYLRGDTPCEPFRDWGKP
jgi:hypothetical protein